MSLYPLPPMPESWNQLNWPEMFCGRPLKIWYCWMAKSKCAFLDQVIALSWVSWLPIAVIHNRHSVKKVFLRTSKNSQENTCTRVSFFLSCRPQPCNFIKKENLTQVFSCEFREISKITFFHRKPLVAPSVPNFLGWGCLC